MKIWCIEDDDSIRDIEVYTLNSTGFEAKGFSDSTAFRNALAIEKPDLIILDPPRDGIHPKALPKIIGYGVERIVYVSCKPTSLARDLEAFLAGGYTVERAVAVDQFPWTANVETVVLLSKGEIDSQKIRVEVLAGRYGYVQV